MSSKPYISEIILNGFKSFPMKTAVRLHEDITCIVGPNGCGKSNLCDAIQWVLGEQAPTQVRSQNMAELIFAGTSQRKPYGLAEVTLVLSRPDEASPEQRKMSITRRVVSSGDSQYLIDDKAVRLKDLLDLLNSAGMNINSYSIIGQGRIESVLTMRASEKRLLIEEAAGILRFREKRRATLLKLEDAGKNLEIVSGILKEQESQARSLKIQAGRARAFLRMVEEEKELLKLFYGQSREKFSRELEQLQAVLLEKQGIQSEILKNVSALEAQSGEKDLALVALFDDQKKAQEFYYTAQTEAEKRRVVIATLRDKLKEGAERSASIAAQRESLEREEQELQTLTEQEARDLAASEEQKRAGDAGLQALRTALETLEADFIRERDRLEGLRVRELDALRTRQALGTDLAVHQDRLGKMGESLALRNTELETFLVRERELNGLLDAAERRVEEGRERLGDLIRRMAELDEWRQTHGRDLAGALQAREAVQADLNRRLGEREVERRALAQMTPPEGALAPLLKPPVAWEGMVDLLLDEVASAVARDAESTPETPGFHWRRAHIPAEPLDGATPLRDLLDLDASAPPWLKDSLPGAYFVHDETRLAELADAHPHYTFFDASGRVARGALFAVPPHARRGLLGSTLRLQRLEGEIAGLETALAEQSARVENSRRLLTEVEDRIRQLEDDRRRSFEDFSALERDAAETRLKLAALSERSQEIRAQIARIEEEKGALEARAASDRQTLQTALQEEERLKAEARDARDKAAAFDIERARGRAELQEAAQAFQKKLFEWQRLEEDLRRHRGTLSAMALQMDKLGEESAGLGTTLSEGRAALEDNEKALEADLARMQEWNRALMERTAEIQTAQNAQRALSQALREERVKLDAVLEEVHQVQTRREVVLAHAEDLKANCLEQTGLRLEECPVGEDPELEAKLKALKEKKDRFGAVNVLAEQEYAEVEAKLTFILTQKEDLEKSIASLKATLGELESAALDRFNATFAKVNEHFQKYFHYLFGGGVAQVRLMDDANPLEAGIEIFVQPPGKRTQHVLLLSGGERVLASAAFLIALFSVSPSPFLILDEGDAALDDVNVERFIELLQRLKETIQIILITHNRRTMEIASTLIGVTMDEPGCSKVIALNPGEVWEKMNL